MNPEQLAVIVYGLMANIAALAVAITAGSVFGAALVFVSSGLTYVFQLAQLFERVYPKLAPASAVLMLLAIVTLPLSVIVSLVGY